MVKVKTQELESAALDYSVAVCEGISPIIDDGRIYSRYPQGKEWDYPITYQNWSQGGPISERERIQVSPHGDEACATYIGSMHTITEKRIYKPPCAAT